MSSSFNPVKTSVLKIYTFSKPPTPEEPSLHPVRHGMIIRGFQRGSNACHTLNSEGEVDLYILLSEEEVMEELPEESEKYSLEILDKNILALEIEYNEDWESRSFNFNIQNPMDFQSLLCLGEKRKANMYYIELLDGEYICSGVKTLFFPGILCYDVQRFLEGKRPLLLPRFNQELIKDESITEEMLCKKAWGYYLDYTALIERAGSAEDAEEIVSRHCLHGLARLQRSRQKEVKDDLLVLWLGRKIGLGQEQLPREYFSVFLAGNHFCGDPTRDRAQMIFEQELRELPEFFKVAWTSPVAEEAIPIAGMHQNKLFRFHLTEEFYLRCVRIFQEQYQSCEEYISSYQQLAANKKEEDSGKKVCSLVEKRAEKIKEWKEPLSTSQIMDLIRKGKVEDLPIVFRELGRLRPEDMDEALVTLCEKQEKRVEPYLLTLLESEQSSLRAMAIIGLGMIESVRAVPTLINKLMGNRQEATLAKYSLAMIGESSLNELVGLLKHRKAEIRMRGIEALALLGTPQALTAIREMKPDRCTKVEAVRAKVLRQFTNR